MELTSTENAIKKIVLDEFTHPSYAEKKHLIEALDREWLENEVRTLQTKGRRLPWALVIGGTLVSIAWALLLILDDTTMMQKAVRLTQAQFFLFAIAGGGLVTLYNRRKRLFLYRILQVLAGKTENARNPQTAAAY